MDQLDMHRDGSCLPQLSPTFTPRVPAPLCSLTKMIEMAMAFFTRGIRTVWRKLRLGDLVRTPCGPCSCLAGEEQSTALRNLGNGWNVYEYIEM